MRKESIFRENDLGKDITCTRPGESEIEETKRTIKTNCSGYLPLMVIEILKYL